jgi:hypothetical protein
MVATAAPFAFCSPIAPGGAFCSTTADPFLLLKSTPSWVERILQRSGQPLRRTWRVPLWGGGVHRGRPGALIPASLPPARNVPREEVLILASNQPIVLASQASMGVLQRWAVASGAGESHGAAMYGLDWSSGFRS